MSTTQKVSFGEVYSKRFSSLHDAVWDIIQAATYAVQLSTDMRPTRPPEEFVSKLKFYSDGLPALHVGEFRFGSANRFMHDIEAEEIDSYLDDSFKLCVRLAVASRWPGYFLVRLQPVDSVRGIITLESIHLVKVGEKV